MTPPKRKARKPEPVKVKEPASDHRCRDCLHATPYTKEHLDVHHGRPLLATCPYREHMVLLSQPACIEHFTKAED